MRHIEVGGTRLSVIGLGTWQFGSREWGYGSAYADKEAGAIVGRALDLGINLIDTAEIYAFGRSERIVGAAVAGRREEAFLATKLFPVLPVGPIVDQRARGSARRLGVDRIDLYQLHWPNPVVPLSATMPGMSRLVRSGLVSHVGVSNYSLQQWQAAESALGGPVLSNQVQFSLLRRGPASELVPWASGRDRVVIAYSPLAQGFLSARYKPGDRPGGMRSVSPTFQAGNIERAAELFETLRRVAAAHDATAAQVALAWVVHHPNVVVIPGASSVEQVERNAEAGDLKLSEAEFEELTDAARRFQPLPAASALTRSLRRFRPAS